MEGVTEMKPKTGDVVILTDRHAYRIGTVLDVFRSATGVEIYDVRLNGDHRIAVLAVDIVANLGPYGAEGTTLQ